MSDQINPKHYGGDLLQRVIEFFGLNFARGSILKYVARAGRKDDELADLKKADWYLQREIVRVQAERAAVIEPASDESCTCPTGDGSLRWPCPTHPPTGRVCGAIVGAYQCAKPNNHDGSCDVEH